MSAALLNTPIVFLGPSLPLQDARQLLPAARYCPPVRCGDILSLLRLGPATFAIIDGQFESTGAVWHKEILYALARGTIVLEASTDEDDLPNRLEQAYFGKDAHAPLA